MRIALFLREFLIQHQHELPHRLSDRFQELEIPRKHNPGGQFACPSLLERIEHTFHDGTGRRFVGTQVGNNPHEIHGKIMQCGAHKLRLQLAGRSEMVKNIRVRHPQIFRNGLERHRIGAMRDK